MKASTFLSAICLGAGVYAKTDEFEAPDFNITDALLANGINVSALPELAPLVERTLTSGCSIAVRTHLREILLLPFADNCCSATP
jgi:hypothetical protein